jgi:hypothetical protein
MQKNKMSEKAQKKVLVVNYLQKRNKGRSEEETK